MVFKRKGYGIIAVMKGREAAQPGFTIVELLIVVVVIAILAAVTIVAYNGIQERARSSSVASLLSQVSKKVQAQKVLNEDVLPASLDGLLPGTMQVSDFEYWLFNGSKDYCLSTVDSKGNYYYIRSDKMTIAASGRCSEVDWIAGAPLAAVTTPGASATLSTPLSGAPDITLYVVVTVVNANAAWQQYAGLNPNTTSNRFVFQSANTGDTGAGYRLDSPATNNASDAQSNVRTPGAHIGWVQVSNGATIRSFAYDKVSSHNTTSFAAGSGWNFTSLFLGSNHSSHTPVAAIVYNAAHDEATRRVVMGWLAKKYSTGQSF